MGKNSNSIKSRLIRLFGRTSTKKSSNAKKTAQNAPQKSKNTNTLTQNQLRQNKLVERYMMTAKMENDEQ